MSFWQWGHALSPFPCTSSMNILQTPGSGKQTHIDSQSKTSFCKVSKNNYGIPDTSLWRNSTYTFLINPFSYEFGKNLCGYHICVDKLKQKLKGGEDQPLLSCCFCVLGFPKISSCGKCWYDDIIGRQWVTIWAEGKKKKSLHANAKWYNHLKKTMEFPKKIKNWTTNRPSNSNSENIHEGNKITISRYLNLRVHFIAALFTIAWTWK